MWLGILLGILMGILFAVVLLIEEKHPSVVMKTLDILKELLASRNVGYNEVTFREYLHFEKPESSKELFFATNEKSLKKAILTSKENNINSCTYYPKVKGNFRMKYFYFKEKQEQIEDYYLRGVIELDDKLIIIVKNGDVGLYYNKVIHELEKLNMPVVVNYSEEIEEPIKEKKLVKKEND